MRMVVNKSRLDTFKKFTLRDETFRRVREIEDVLRVDKSAIWGGSKVLSTLYELAAGYHTGGNNREGYCLELGTHRGGSASVMASALKDSNTKYKPLFTIDSYIPFSDGSNQQFVADSYRIAREAFHKLGLTEYVCPVIYDDLSFLRFWTLPTRLVYLDSSHHYGHTKEGIQMLMSRLMPDGWLALHDYLEADESYIAVLPALNDFLDEQTQYDLEVFDGGESLVCIHLRGWQ